MNVSAIQNQLTSSSNGLTSQAKKPQYSAGIIKDSPSDGFSKEQTNTISFKGDDGKIKGGLTGGFIGAVAGAIAEIATGGAAVPWLAIYYGSLIGGAAAGTVIGDKVEDGFD